MQGMQAEEEATDSAASEEQIGLSEFEEQVPWNVGKCATNGTTNCTKLFTLFRHRGKSK